MDEGSANWVQKGEIEPQINNSQAVIGGSLRSKTEDGSTGQDHVQEDGSMTQDHVQKHGCSGQDHVQEVDAKVHGHVQEHDSTGQHDCHTSQTHVGEDGPEKQLEKSNSRIGDIDTTAPFESVKEAVSMFTGIVDWKAHKIQIAERRKRVAQELRKAQEEIPQLKKKSEAAEESKQQVLKELDNVKRRLEELKLNIESAQTEESEAKQDAELTKLRVEEMEQGISDESSVAAKEQLEVAQARHKAAVSELQTVKLELQNLQNDYALLVSDRDLAINDAQEAVANFEETEKNAEDLTIKLITTKEALESAHGGYLEAEDHRNEVSMAQEQDRLNGYEELKQSEEELENVSRQMAETEDLKSKLDSTWVLFENLKAELASYMEETHNVIQSQVDLAKTELEEVKKNIEEATHEVNHMKLHANSMSMELEQEKAKLAAIKQNKWTEEGVMVSLEGDIMRTISQVVVIQLKEKEAQSVQLPKQLEKAIEEADHAKSRAQKSREELRKAKKAAKQAKKGETTVTSKLNAAVRKVEAARASERLVVGAMSAVEESESDESEPESGVTLSLEKHYELSRKAKEAEDEANDRVSEAISQIDFAKESEVKAQSRLEQVKADIALKKEELSDAVEKAEKAKEGKLVVERELRMWRAERRKAKEDAEALRKKKKKKKKKKRSLIHKIFFMFLCTKKGQHSNKINKYR